MSEEQIKNEIQAEELKLKLLDQQLEMLEECQIGSMEDAIFEKEEEEFNRREQQLQSLIDPLCEQMLNLRFFITESNSNEEIFRIGEHIQSLLDQLNGQMPDIDTLIGELIVRHSRESDVKLVQMAKNLYANKLTHIHSQLKIIVQACEGLIEFLKTKIYGGVLLRKAINELNEKVAMLERLPNQEKTALLNEFDEQLVQELIDFDFNDRLSQLRTHLGDELKKFVT